MGEEWIRATYWVETPLSLEEAAEAIAGEQSSGTFVAVPGETAELRERHRARVESVRPLGEVDCPTLLGARYPNVAQRFRRGEVRIAFPFENVGTNLPTLLATVAGNLYELKELSGLRLVDLELPEAYGRAYAGPQFGVAGTRELTGVFDRPVIGTIVKPSVGLTPEQTARLVQELAEAGIDFIKDDELQANSPHSPFAERARAVLRAVHEHADRTGKRVMVALNITDDLDAMMRHHDLVYALGGTCVMVSLNSVGWAGVHYLRQRAALPIHGHRNGWGMWTRCELLGMEFRVYQKLWRLLGVDHLHVNGLDNKFWEPNESVVRSIRACLTPIFRDSDCAMPVVSSGQWGGQAPETYRQTQTVDLMYLAGGGIMAHPGGPASGVRAIRQAWEAAVGGIPLEEYARTHPELAEALRRFGTRE
ncbi:MAG: ribulose-bisphosphate carboxylase [Candidatus Poribacteria bacterium]|nr:MAG: ribulose-bisphosphate carboxylase [Candidatus Poribacteria bacterium]